MALADRVQPPSTTGTPCSVGLLLATLEGEELAALEMMLGTPEQRGWTAAAIYDAVTAEGYTVSYQQINKHRGGRCRCGASA